MLTHLKPRPLWITHQGKRIFYTDFRACSTEVELFELFEAAAEIMFAQTEPVLTLNNVAYIDVSPALMKRVRTRGAEYRHNVRGKAVVGIDSAFKRTMFNVYGVLTGIDARAFHSEEEALQYLVTLE
jgi:hypothetical protein